MPEKDLIRECEICGPTFTPVHKTPYEGVDLYLCAQCRRDLGQTDQDSQNRRTFYEAVFGTANPFFDDQSAAILRHASEEDLTLIAVNDAHPYQSAAQTELFRRRQDTLKSPTFLSPGYLTWLKEHGQL